MAKIESPTTQDIKESAGTEQTDGVRISQYYARFRKSENAFSSQRSLWTVLDTFDRGEQWKDAVIPPWVPKPITNYIRYFRTLKRANMASNIVKAHFTSISEANQPAIDKLQKAYEFVWTTQKVPLLVRRCVDRSFLQGTAVAYVYNDDTYVGGQYYGASDPKNRLFKGRICVKRIPLPNFFPDPDAYCLEDCKYVEMTDIMSLPSVKVSKTYVDYTKKNGTYNKLKELNQKMTRQDDENGTIFNRDTKPGDGYVTHPDELVTVHIQYERYFGDDNKWHLDCTHYIPYTDFFLWRQEDIKPNVYPFGILYDEEEEQSFFGSATAFDVLENQKVVNKVSQTASIIATMHQNPQKVVSRESGVNAQELARTGTMPGKVWTANGDPSKAIHITQPMDIPRGLFETDDRMKMDMKETMGINEAYTGNRIGSLTTSTGVNALIDRATIRDRDKMLQIDDFVEQLSSLIVQFIIHTWKDSREIVTKGPGGKPEWTIFEPIADGDIENLAWIAKSDVYATSPVTAATRKQQADNLLQIQGQFQFNPAVIIPEEWIKFQDFDIKDEILQRMEQDRQNMQVQQQQNLAGQIASVAQQLLQAQSKGASSQQVQQIAMQAAQQILQEQQASQAKEEGSAPAEKQGPQGTTGALAMNAMARGK